MSRYTREIEVEAYQIHFSEKDKEIAKKGLPVYSHGTTIRCEDGALSVLIGTRHAFEGDWVVTEGGQLNLYTDEAFRATFKKVAEAPVATQPNVEAAPAPADLKEAVKSDEGEAPAPDPAEPVSEKQEGEA